MGAQVSRTDKKIENEIIAFSKEKENFSLKKFFSDTLTLNIISILLFLGVWYYTVYTNVLGRGLCYPHEVITQLYSMCIKKIAGKFLWEHFWDSTRRILIGYSIACCIAIPLGFFMGLNRKVNAVIMPIFNLIKPMPPIAWISLSILWLGIEEAPKIFIISIGTFVPCLLNSYNGIRLIDEELYDVIRMSGGTKNREIWEVSFPGTLPAVFAGLQISMSGAWSCVLAAELVSSRSGLGFIILQGMNFGMPDMIIGGMLLIALISFLSSMGINYLEKLICPYKREIENV